MLRHGRVCSTGIPAERISGVNPLGSRAIRLKVDKRRIGKIGPLGESRIAPAIPISVAGARCGTRHQGRMAARRIAGADTIFSVRQGGLQLGIADASANP